MQASIHTLYRSAFCEVKNFTCNCMECSLSKTEYQDKFSICYVRSGNFIFKVFKNDLDSYTGHFLINKPLFEHKVAHLDRLPDACTIFSFSQTFYEELVTHYRGFANGFFSDADKHSMLIPSSAALNYLHNHIFNLLHKPYINNLEIDCKLIELVRQLFSQQSVAVKPVSAKFKQQYLYKIEGPLSFIHSGFSDNISLAQIAAKAFMSPFHFARIFKQLTGFSPYQYLLQYRLNHAKHLLQNSPFSIGQIATHAGFENPDYFSAAFKSSYKISPSQLRTYK